MDNGFIEIGNIATQASSEVIKKVKSILDRHCIYHISDGVIFHPSHRNGASRRPFLLDRVKEGNHSHNEMYSDKQLLVDLENYQELMVPYLYKHNFMSIVYFDADEADFLAMLIYKEN